MILSLGAASSLLGQTLEGRMMGEVVFGCVPVSHICCVYSWVWERERGVCVCLEWGGIGYESVCACAPKYVSLV